MPYYQPETAFTVFTRIINGDDIGWGRNVDLSTFGTEGPSSSERLNKKPKEPASTCWLRDQQYSCTEDEREAINQGHGMVKDGVWFRSDEAASTTTPQFGPVMVPVKPTTTLSNPLTGVYVATGPPTSSATSGSARRASPGFRLPRQVNDDLAPERPAKNSPKKESRKTRNGLIGGLAAAGGLLL